MEDEGPLLFQITVNRCEQEYKIQIVIGNCQVQYLDSKLSRSLLTLVIGGYKATLTSEKVKV